MLAVVGAAGVVVGKVAVVADSTNANISTDKSVYSQRIIIAQIYIIEILADHKCHTILLTCLYTSRMYFPYRGQSGYKSTKV